MDERRQWECPECGSVLKFIVSRGLICPNEPDEHGPYKTAWKEGEGGEKRQYFACVEDKKREKEEAKPFKTEAEKCPVA